MKWRGNLLKSAALDLSEFAVSIHTGGKELFHVIGHDVDRFVHGRNRIGLYGTGVFEPLLFGLTLCLGFASRLYL